MESRKLFKDKNFTLFLLGNNTSVFGDIFLLTGFSLFVILNTKSALQFSLTLAITFIPRIFLSPFSGVMVDRLKKKNLVIFLDIIRGLWLTGLYVISMKTSLTMNMIYVTFAFFAVCDTFFGPAYTTIFTKIIKKENLTSANAISGSIKNTVSVVTPLIASFVFATFGLPLLLLIDALTFFISAFLEFYLSFEDTLATSTQKITSDFNDALNFIDKNIRLKSLLINGNLTHFFLFPFIEVGVIYLLLIIFKAPELHFGFIQSSQSLGAILAGFFAMYYKNKNSLAKNINIGIIGMLISVLLFDLLILKDFRDILLLSNYLPTLYLSITCFVIFLAFNFYGVFFGSFYQGEVPSEYIGRFTSILIMTFSISRLIGMLMYGYLLENDNLSTGLIILFIGMSLKLLAHIPFAKFDSKTITNTEESIKVETK